jgi:peroxiredoxin Q/BCP
VLFTSNTALNDRQLSKDKPEAQEKWATKKELQYELLSDPESKLIKRLGSFVAPNK